MTRKNIVVALAIALGGAGCATLEPMPFATGKDCFYPSCTLDVEVVDNGKGGKTLKVEADGNVRMGTRHRLVAIVWKLRTPGYEFHTDSVAPQRGSVTSDTTAQAVGQWQEQMLWHGYSWYDTVSVTNRNNERAVLRYDITVYPSRGTPGGPISFASAVMNDPCPNVALACR